MKVLIITYYWPPAGGSGVQRWLKFVKYLQGFDIEPIIYTVDNPNYAIVDETLQNEVPNTVEILKQPIKEPNNLLSLFGSKKQKTSAGFLDANPSFFGKIAQYIRANFFIPDARKYWIKPSVKYLTNYLENNKVDVIISTGPPHSLHLIGLQLKQKLSRSLGIKWIADFRDPWTDIDYFYQLPLTQKSIDKHFQLEKEVVSNADCVLVVGKTMKENYLKFNKNIEVITNGFDDNEEVKDVELDAKFSFVHIGMMNADRNPKTLWKVLSEILKENNAFANDFQLKLIGKCADEVLESIKNNGLISNVEMIDYLSHNKVIAFQKSAQVLLLAVNNVPSAKGIITGKIFEYLQANRPILAIAPTNGDLAEIISTTNSGNIVDFEDAETLKNTILEFYNAYKNNNLVVDSKEIEQYHRKNLTKQLTQVIKDIID
ncbi:MAG: glycosyltransferase family 4 protein [Flavobacteriaceae bacterium]|nr:glycosyltransferase family 4 protein [Flavobacteriaceae bacterium]